MIDRIVKINDKEAVIVFTDHPSFTVTSSTGSVLNVVFWLLSPSKLTVSEYARAATTNLEETAPCITLKVA